MISLECAAESQGGRKMIISVLKQHYAQEKLNELM